MSSNPFSIKLPEASKKVQGQNGVNPAQSTPETREAAETKGLKSTDVYSYAKGNQGEQGNFQNYDGFISTKPEESEDEKECEDATNDAKDSQSSAKKATKQSDASTDAAQNDVKDLKKISKNDKTREKQTISEVNKNDTQTQALQGENDAVESEIDDMNSEIQQLMAEDGQTYTPQAVDAGDEKAPAAAPQAPQEAPAGDGAGMTATAETASADGGMGAMTGGAADMGGAMGGSAMSNPFAMNSAPAPAPVQESQNGGQKPAPQNGQAQQGATSPVAKSGGSVGAFGSTMPSAKGKNADKINDLFGQVGNKQSTMSFNTSSIMSMRSSSTSKLAGFQNFLNTSKATAGAKKASNTKNNGLAQGAQLTGAAVTTSGGVITGIASVKMASALPPVSAAGGALMPWGLGTTAAGGATTTAASFAQGNTADGISQANTTAGSTSSCIVAAKQAKANIS